MRIINLLFFLLFLGHFSLKAQPFSSLDIGASISSLSIQDKSYSSRWDLTSAKSFQIRTPFYIGIAGLGIDFFDYNSKNDLYHDIESINFSAYLGFKVLQSNRVNILPSILVGIQKSDFENDEIDTSNTKERELFIATNLELQYKVGKIILFGDLQYTKIYNFYRQNIFSVGAGARIHLSFSKKVYEFID